MQYCKTKHQGRSPHTCHSFFLSSFFHHHHFINDQLTAHYTVINVKKICVHLRNLCAFICCSIRSRPSEASSILSLYSWGIALFLSILKDIFDFIRIKPEGWQKGRKQQKKARFQLQLLFLLPELPSGSSILMKSIFHLFKRTFEAWTAFLRKFFFINIYFHDKKSP